MATTNTDTDTAEGMDLLREKIEDGVFTIDIIETPFGKETKIEKEGKHFTLSPEENEALNTLVDKYADVMLDIHDVDETYDGLNRAWHMGRLLEEENETVDEFSITEIMDCLPVENVSDSQAYRFRLVYKMFPNQGYEDPHNPTLISQLARLADDYATARAAYQNMVESDEMEKVTQAEARAWGELESETPSLDAVTEAVVAKVGSETTRVRGVKRLYVLCGQEDVPDDAAIEDALDAAA